MSGSQKLIALLIDDDCDDVELLTASLRKTGRFEEVLCYDNAIAALDYLAESGTVPDVIITDLKMPQMTGAELIQAIKADPTRADVPILIFTGSTFHKDIQDTQLQGASGYIVKPSAAEHYDMAASLITAYAERAHITGGHPYLHHFRIG